MKSRGQANDWDTSRAMHKRVADTVEHLNQIAY